MQLRVSNFSCIKDANLQFGTITVLIGPQASGKSVLCKLAYFCLDALKFDPTIEQDSITFESFKSAIKQKFYEWFPLSAWGSDQFVIEFQIGELELKFSRTIYKTKLQENIRIWASDGVHQYFDDVSRFANDLAQKSKKKPDDLYMERSWQVYVYAMKALEKRMAGDSIDSQIFVPAGRSFFTSLGKAVAAFEHGRVLDPLTLTFGRMYANVRDRRHLHIASTNPMTKRIMNVMNAIFGGELKSDKESEYVLTTDGRRIPLSALSSGQQELLPLMTMLPYIRPNRRESAGSLVYIEEPEAHLFPQAQGQLVEVLSSMVNFSRQSLRMVLTTHSPYVLSKYNNLIKAGQLAKKFKDGDQYKEKKVQLDNLVSPGAQVGEGQVKAYAIVDGILTEIIEDDGLINAEYLDKVSGEISSQFSGLLNLEYSA